MVLDCVSGTVWAPSTVRGSDVLWATCWATRSVVVLAYRSAATSVPVSDGVLAAKTEAGLAARCALGAHRHLRMARDRQRIRATTRGIRRHRPHRTCAHWPTPWSHCVLASCATHQKLLAACAHPMSKRHFREQTPCSGSARARRSKCSAAPAPCNLRADSSRPTTSGARDRRDRRATSAGCSAARRPSRSRGPDCARAPVRRWPWCDSVRVVACRRSCGRHLPARTSRRSDQRASAAAAAAQT